MSVLAYTVPPCLGSSDTSSRRRSSINTTQCALSTRHTDPPLLSNAATRSSSTRSNKIFSLALFRLSVIQTELNVFVADVLDSGVGERGALVLRQSSIWRQRQSPSLMRFGFGEIFRFSCPCRPPGLQRCLSNRSWECHRLQVPLFDHRDKSLRDMLVVVESMFAVWRSCRRPSQAPLTSEPLVSMIKLGSPFQIR